MSGPKSDAQVAAELAELEAEINAGLPEPARPCTDCEARQAAGARLEDLDHRECAAELSRRVRGEAA